MMSKRTFKICVIGEARVGKTSISMRYCKGTFDEKQESTWDASYLDKEITNPDGSIIKFCLWDTAGQEKFHAITPVYYRDADGAILVYDITDDDSFKKVEKWVTELKKFVENVAIVIVGNKIDLEENRVINEMDAINYATDVGAKHFNTSAKNGRGIEELFLYLSKEITEIKTQYGKRGTTQRVKIKLGAGEKSESGEIKSGGSQAKAQKKKDCC